MTLMTIYKIMYMQSRAINARPLSLLPHSLGTPGNEANGVHI